MIHLTAEVLTKIRSMVESQYDIKGEFVFASTSEKGIVAVLIEDDSHPQHKTVVQVPHLVIYNGNNLKLNDRAHLPETIDEMVNLAKSLT